MIELRQITTLPSITNDNEVLSNDMPVSYENLKRYCFVPLLRNIYEGNILRLSLNRKNNTISFFKFERDKIVRYEYIFHSQVFERIKDWVDEVEENWKRNQATFRNTPDSEYKNIVDMIENSNLEQIYKTILSVSNPRELLEYLEKEITILEPLTLKMGAKVKSVLLNLSNKFHFDILPSLVGANVADANSVALSNHLSTIEKIRKAIEFCKEVISFEQDKALNSNDLENGKNNDGDRYLIMIARSIQKIHDNPYDGCEKDLFELQRIASEYYHRVTEILNSPNYNEQLIQLARHEVLVLISSIDEKIDKKTDSRIDRTKYKEMLDSGYLLVLNTLHNVTDNFGQSLNSDSEMSEPSLRV